MQSKAPAKTQKSSKEIPPRNKSGVTSTQKTKHWILRGYSPLRMTCKENLLRL